MAISVVLTFNSTAYDISNYVIRHSIEVDEYLFNADNLRPNTNSAKLRLSRGCPYIDELFAWTGDVEIVITNDGTTVFTGYLTDNYSLKISSRGASDIELTAEDPGIKKLKTTWASTGGIVTNFSGKKVCDPADTGNSFVHILATLAGVTLAATPPTISDLLYFSVRDADTPTYWDILDGVLSEYLHTFYFNSAGELALFALAGLTGTPSQLVESSSTILSKEMNGAGIEVQKRLIQYKEVVVSFKEVETISSIMVYQDATGQAATDCLIPITAGAYYPTSCDADTYSYVDYKLADGREVLSVGSITEDITVDSGITYSVTNLGKSAQVRFYNPTGGTLYIRRLRVTGNNVIAKKADSKCTSIGATGGKKLEASASYITATDDAKEYANLLRYFYANSGATYSFRAYHGNLYPSAALYPSTTLYPMGDLITLGELVRLYDPIWTGLDVNCAIYRKSYIVGKAGAQYGAVGIGTITLSDAVSRYPVQPPMSPPVTPIPEIRNTLKTLTTLSDSVDFTGQYGIYNGTRYIGTTPATWTRADAGQTVSEVQAAIPVYVPGYLGAFKDSAPVSAQNGDVYLRYSETSGETNRGVFKYDGSTWSRTTSRADIMKAAQDIVQICEIYDPAGTAKLYGDDADYGIDTTIDVAHIRAAIIDMLRVGDLSIYGKLKAQVMETVDSQDGDTISAPSPTYWPGSELVTHCATLADGWHAVDATSTLGGKNVTHVVKGSTSAVSYQSSDAEATYSGSSIYKIKTITSAVTGPVILYFDSHVLFTWDIATVAIAKDSNSTAPLQYFTVSTTGYSSFSMDVNAVAGSTYDVYIIGSATTVYVRNFRLSPQANTIGIWNDTDSTAIVASNSNYLNASGNINVTGLSDFTTSSYDDYWPGSSFISSFSGKVRGYIEQAVDGGTFNSKTCESVYITGIDSIRITFTDSSTLSMLATGYYNYTGSVILLEEDARILVGESGGAGQYEIWPHNIPGTTDEIVTVRNTETADAFSIFEVRAPDKTSGNSESTYSLHNVHNSTDFVNDKSMHNYAGDMHVLDVFSNFTNDTLGDWKWYQQRRVAAWQTSTAYTVGDFVYNDPAAGINKIYLCIYISGTGTSSSSGGPTGTGKNITDGSSPNHIIWQYVGVEDSAGSAMWGETSARIYSNSGSLWTKGGRRVTGSISGGTAVTEDYVFNLLAPAIPNVGDTVIVSGAIKDGSVIKVVSFATRYAYYEIRLHAVYGSNFVDYQMTSGSSNTLYLLLAW